MSPGSLDSMSLYVCVDVQVPQVTEGRIEIAGFTGRSPCVHQWRFKAGEGKRAQLKIHVCGAFIFACKRISYILVQG